MSECCQGKKQCDHKTDFWNWWTEQERTFTVAEVKDLLERVKVFNAGAIDAYLTNHVEKSFTEWAKELEAKVSGE